jgi:hypothetical protein
MQPSMSYHMKVNFANIAFTSGTVRFSKCKQLFKYKHSLLLVYIWWLVIVYINFFLGTSGGQNLYLNAVHFFQLQC